MRLWHKDLIPYLPRQQLLGQWRELNSIYKLQNRHILINFIYDYPKEDLFTYSNLVINEMHKRGYKYNLENRNNYFPFYDLWFNSELPTNKDIFKDKMTDRYLKQCLFNLQEKYDCGGITPEEWKIIEEKFGKEFNLWKGND